MLDGLTGVLGSSEENNVSTSWCTECQLIESQAFTAGLLDSSPGSRCESECDDGQLWYGLESAVICDSANNCDGLSGVFLLCALGGGLADDSGDGDWWSVYSRHKQSLEDDLVEVGIGSS